MIQQRASEDKMREEIVEKRSHLGLCPPDQLQAADMEGNAAKSLVLLTGPLLCSPLSSYPAFHSEQWCSAVAAVLKAAAADLCLLCLLQQCRVHCCGHFLSSSSAGSPAPARLTIEMFIATSSPPPSHLAFSTNAFPQNQGLHQPPLDWEKLMGEE